LLEDTVELESMIDMISEAPAITKEQAECYMFKHQNLRRSFGEGPNAWVKAATHWKMFGHQNGWEMC